MAKRRKWRTSRERRHLRVRRKVSGTPERPRLSVFRSLRHTYAQLIEDESARTLAAASTLEPEAGVAPPQRATVVGARVVGRLLAERARAVGVQRVVFDRGGYLYHGRVQALAEGAREGGLEF